MHSQNNAHPFDAPADRPAAENSALSHLCSSRPPSSATSTRRAPADWNPPATRLALELLPPLPPIRCSQLAIQARTHRTWHPTSVDGAAVHPYERELASLEPLEMIGDRRLNWEFAKQMRRRFPMASSAVLAHLTSMIVRNATISYFAYAYRLDDGVRRAASDTPCSQGLAADLFEAHVGALAEYEELHPLEPPHLSQWLAQLVSDATLPDLAKEASERIAQLRAPRVTKGTSTSERFRWSCTRCSTGSSTVVSEPTITFDQFDQEAGWHGHVWHDGRHVACASGKNKKEAELKALYSAVASSSAAQR